MKTKVLTISLLISNIIYGASFDCKKATTPTEKAICTDVILSGMDDALLNAYRYATTYSNQDISQIKTNHKNWINKSLIKCNGNQKCIYNSMLNEIQYLSRTVPINTKIGVSNISNQNKIDLSSIPQLKDKQIANVPITQKMLYALTYTISGNNPNFARFEFDLNDISKDDNREYEKIKNFLIQNKISFKTYKSYHTQTRALSKDNSEHNILNEKNQFPNLVYIDVPNCTIPIFNKVMQIKGNGASNGNMGLALESFNMAKATNLNTNDLSTKNQYLNLISELKELANKYASTKNAKANAIESLFLCNTYSTMSPITVMPDTIKKEDYDNGKAGDLVSLYTKDKDLITYDYIKYTYDYNTISPNWTLPVKYYYYNEFQKNYKKLWGENY